MTERSPMAGDELVAEVSVIAEGVFGALAPLVAAAETIVNGARRAATAELARLRGPAREVLGGLVVGAGFIAAPHSLADHRFGFAWWTTTGGGPPSRLVIDLDPAGERFFDYTRQSWFTVPRDTGRRHITGPYVDYLCTDEYTLTFTIPIHRAGTFAGVAGADVVVREFERAVLPGLRALGGRAALVNAQSRVIVSSDVRRPVGSLVRAPDIPGWWAAGSKPCAEGGAILRRCGDTPIALLTTPD